MDGKLHQSGYVVNIELSHEARAIGIYRFGTEFQPGRDLLGPDSIDQERENLIFPGAEHLQRIVRRVFLAWAENLVQLQFGRNVNSSIQNLLKGFQQLSR